MASRGTPIPFMLRQKARELEFHGVSRVAIARTLGVHRNTVRKYLGAKFVQNRSELAT